VTGERRLLHEIAESEPEERTKRALIRRFRETYDPRVVSVALGRLKRTGLISKSSRLAVPNRRDLGYPYELTEAGSTLIQGLIGRRAAQELEQMHQERPEI